jgi:hypothetical protein
VCYGTQPAWPATLAEGWATEDGLQVGGVVSGARPEGVGISSATVTDVLYRALALRTANLAPGRDGAAPRDPGPSRQEAVLDLEASGQDRWRRSLMADCAADMA